MAYCILAKDRAPRFYKTILKVLESHHGIPDKQKDLLFSEFYKLEFPKLGHSLKINLGKIVNNDIKFFSSSSGTNVKKSENDLDLNSFHIVGNEHGQTRTVPIDENINRYLNGNSEGEESII